MKLTNNEWARGLAAHGLAVGLTAALATAGVAQSVTGRAYGAYASTPTGSVTQSPLAVLPAISGTDGDMANAQSSGVDVGGVLSSTFLNSITSGALGATEAGAQSVATVGSTNILNGLITAQSITAMATSSRTAAGAESNANGSSYANLVVAGTQVTNGDGSVAPNTRIDLPGVGYVVLNEQIRTGDGATSSGLTVNMVHVYLQGPTGGLLGGELGTIGEIVVGSATSSVGS
jgi:hypothetical protein